jgi:hypothetical protein
MINYLINKKDLIKIFADFYYVKNKKEISSKNFKKKHTLVGLVSKLLEMMKVEDWYFGLHSALRLHGISLKDNPAECLICSRVPFNSKRLEVLGKKLQVFVFKQNLFDFYIEKNGVKYSDLEKTFLDFIYLWKLNHVPDHKLLGILGKYRDKISKEKLITYSEIYPREIQLIINEFIG